MMQCIAQALPISARKGGSGAKGGEALAPLLALPHFDQDVLKKLRKQRITTLKGEGGRRCSQGLAALVRGLKGGQGEGLLETVFFAFSCHGLCGNLGFEYMEAHAAALCTATRVHQTYGANPTQPNLPKPALTNPNKPPCSCMHPPPQKKKTCVHPQSSRTCLSRA